MSGFLRMNGAVLAVLTVACGGTPEFPPVVRDGGIVCSPPRPDAGPPRDSGPPPDAGPPRDASMDASMDATSPPDLPPCPTGQVCLSGRCYAECTSDDECAPSEMCTGGACVVRTMPRVDGGPADSGPVDPCDGVMCEGALVCHPRSGTCVQCLGPPGVPCPAVTPVCNVARGTCETFQPGACAPCAIDADCMDAVGTSYGRCVMRPDEFESVCVPDCIAGTCAAGLSCNAMNQCVPRVGSCTGYRAALQLLTCTADTDCIPLGAPVAPGQCVGAVPAPDGGTPTPGTCRQPCGLVTDCPSGLNCTADFCVP